MFYFPLSLCVYECVHVVFCTNDWVSEWVSERICVYVSFLVGCLPSFTFVWWSMWTATTTIIIEKRTFSTSCLLLVLLFFIYFFRFQFYMFVHVCVHCKYESMILWSFFLFFSRHFSTECWDKGFTWKKD